MTLHLHSDLLRRYKLSVSSTRLLQICIKTVHVPDGLRCLLRALLQSLCCLDYDANKVLMFKKAAVMNLQAACKANAIKDVTTEFG